MATCTKKKSKLGTTIIDELRLCYTAEPSLLAILRECRVAERIDFSDFYMVRVNSRYFHSSYHICSTAAQKQIATINFDRIGDNNSNYVWLRPENWTLYDDVVLQSLLRTIPDTFSLRFNNITAIDLAKDFKKNITNLIRRLYKDKTITTIVNGKAIRDRKRIIPEFYIAHSVSLDRLLHPTFYAKQKSALHDKTKGVCVQSYNKKAEIENGSAKQYILDYYDYPKTLHRLEVHLNAEEIRDYFRSRGIVQSADLIFDKTLLAQMYYYHLSSVIRFTKGREKLSWQKLLECNDNIKNE